MSRKRCTNCRHGRTHNDLLWPEYYQLAEALREYLDDATARIIREEVFKDTDDPEAR